jgi:hypothetical protein
MRKTTCRWVQEPAFGDAFRCNPRLGAALFERHAECGPGLCVAADDFAQLIARVDPEQLTSTDLGRLRDLLEQLRLLLNAGS